MATRHERSRQRHTRVSHGGKLQVGGPVEPRRRPDNLERPPHGRTGRLAQLATVRIVIRTISHLKRYIYVRVIPYTDDLECT